MHTLRPSNLVLLDKYVRPVFGPKLKCHRKHRLHVDEINHSHTLHGVCSSYLSHKVIGVNVNLSFEKVHMTQQTTQAVRIHGEQDTRGAVRKVGWNRPGPFIHSTGIAKPMNTIQRDSRRTQRREMRVEMRAEIPVGRCRREPMRQFGGCGRNAKEPLKMMMMMIT
jgi:hypothetical protein